MVLNRDSSRRSRGSVIVVILVTIMLASYLVVRMLEQSSLELILATRDADRRNLRSDAYSALELAVGVLAQVKDLDGGALHAPAQGWGEPVELTGVGPREGVTATFAFEDESGKFPLPGATLADLTALAEALGLPTYEAGRFADAFLAWTDKEHTAVNFEADPSSYERGVQPHRAPQRPIRSYDELADIAIVRDAVYDKDGRLTGFGEAFRRCTSLYEFETVNINSAPAELLAMRQLGGGPIKAIQDFLGGATPPAAGEPPYFADLQKVRVIAGGNADLKGFGTDVQLLRVTVTVTEGISIMRVTALVAIDENAGFPEAYTAPGTGTTAGTAATNAPARTTAGTPAGADAPGSGAAQQEETLNYPFKVLEITEDNGPPRQPAPPPESPDEKA